MPYYLSFFSFSDEVSSKLSLNEILESVLTTGVAGYLLVFVILGLIWFILAMFSKLFTHNAANAEIAAEQAPVTETLPIPEPLPTAETEPVGQADDAELIAVIAAAISAYTDKPASGFRVVSFRKKK